MSWPKQKPMDWTWFQESCHMDIIADRCGELAKMRRIVKFIVGPYTDMYGEAVALIVSCHGTPRKRKAKKEASE